MPRLRTFALAIALPLAALAGMAALASPEPVARPARIAMPDIPIRQCLNMGNALEAPTEGEWGPVITREDIRSIAAHGFDTLRLPVAWQEHLGRDNRIDPAFLKRVDEVARWALAEDMNLIVNVHNYWALNEDPAAHIPVLHAIWAQLARHYADWPDTLMFEIVNEPQDAFIQDLVNRVNADALAGIRQTNPTRWVVLGGAAWGTIEPFKAGTDAPFTPASDPRTIATFHSYTPFEWSHQGARFIDAPPPVGRRLNVAKDTRAIREEMRHASDFRARTGMPIFLGEFGSYRHLPHAERVAHAEIMRREAEAAGLAWCWFDWQTEFRFADPATKQALPGLKAALFAN